MKKLIMLVMLISSLKGDVVTISEIIAECDGYLQKADSYMEKSIEKHDKYSDKGLIATDSVSTYINTYVNMSRLMQERYRICVTKLYKK